jgi:uncharacterized protein YyaL (SSP411 family)
MSAPRSNRLIKEKSPYLLQHAYNPVDWFPWGEEAFTRAIHDDKPIFLSIGYSTCHWCHVMEKESFEDPAVAKLMNRVFICVKVDREERPDIDSLYMDICQMLTQRGGWPLTIIMTPDKKPFFTGTYLPRSGRMGMAGMLELIPQIEKLWINRKADLIDSAEKIITAVNQAALDRQPGDLGETILDQAYQQLSSNFDAQYGGFGTAPKFPTPHHLAFLLRYGERKHDQRALDMVRISLEKMRSGGIWDHIGFGFHRYSTDAKWLLPHFEKMLYDQALLARVYTEAFQVMQHDRFQATALQIFTYVLQDMISPEGAFYSAEDADSEGEEGRFYIWEWQELENLLNKNEMALAAEVYNLHKEGNFQDEATGRKSGTNILHMRAPLEDLAREKDLKLNELEAAVENIRQKLNSVRSQRPRPLRDEKILTDWNGLMIAALALGGKVFNMSSLTQAAAKAARFILTYMMDSETGLQHRYREGEASIPAFADDYAFMIWGLLELYAATYDTDYLKSARELNQSLIHHFWDGSKGGFFFTSDSAETLFERRKTIYDGAAPSGNSVAMLNLLRLARMTGASDLEEMAFQLGRHFAQDVSRLPSAYTQLLVALDFALGPSFEVVIVGDPEGSDTKKFFAALHREFIPNITSLFIPAHDKNPEIHRLAPFTQNLKSINSKATAYVCSGFTCSQPTTDPKEMLSQLNRKP